MSRTIVCLAIALAALTVEGIAVGEESPSADFELTSSDIVDGKLDKKHFLSESYGFGCSGDNISPHLSWNGVPVGTESFVLMVSDVDAPTGIGWMHWVVVNIPAGVTELPQGAAGDGERLPNGVLQTRTDFGVPGYGGPCPPREQRHRYVFTLFALKIDKLPGVNEDAMPALVAYHAHANSLGTATLMVTQDREMRQDTKIEHSHQLATMYMPVPRTLDTVGNDYKLPAFTVADKSSLSGKRVLIISADGPELPELDVPLKYLKARGAAVKLAGQNWIFEYRKPAGHIVIAQWLADNICVKADLPLKDVRVAEWDDEAKRMKINYDAIYIPGGAWNPDMLRTDGDALRIVREARAHGVLIVSLCHGPQVLISAARSDPSGQVVFPRGTQITGVQSIRGDLDNAGFTVYDKATVFDSASQLLTARDPKDLGPLCEEMGRLLLLRQSDQQQDASGTVGD